MATTETICKYNQYGFCKHRMNCRKQHVMEVCSNHQCNNLTCTLRHPRPCKFFLNYGRCKFEDACAFLHIRNGVTSQEFENLKEKTNRIEELFNETENNLKAAKARIAFIEEQNERLKTEVAKALEIAKVTELVVKESIEKLVATVSKQQDEMEKRNLI